MHRIPSLRPTSLGRTLEIPNFMNFLLCVEDGFHDDEIDTLAQVWHFDAVHTVEVREEAVWVFLHVAVVIWEDLTEECFFFLGLGFDHVPSVVAVEKKLGRGRRARSNEAMQTKTRVAQQMQLNQLQSASLPLTCPDLALLTNSIKASFPQIECRKSCLSTPAILRISENT
mmetsp:Transcript_58328/g.86731  ORF Transcript_58328/g.86731 Transcript_58328/m.86731 type:complete len:171 (+) Transcript_58328:891-1403(+)